MRFRIRSSQRDLNADAKRLAAIEQAILKAIADAETEMKGLTRRINAQRAQASILMGNGIYGEEDREPESEKQLAGVEEEMSRGTERVRSLNAHLQHLQGMLSTLLAAKKAALS
jgi:chromosome segregation ATPase